MNPEQKSGIISSYQATISPQIMYQYDHHKNIPWNNTEYQPMKQYLDPKMQITMRTFATQKKGSKNSLYTTRRGFYMDYDLKVAKQIPPPNKYKTVDTWDFSKQKSKSLKKKLDPKIMKFTYLEQIEIAQQNRKTPGVCTYRLDKTEQQISNQKKVQKSRKRSIGPKRFFYQDTQYLSNMVPGAGAHSPRLLEKQIKLDKTDNSFWKSKHKKQEQLRKKKTIGPVATTYKPLPVLYSTFEKYLTSPKKQHQTVKGFGTDQKFEYLREQKVPNKIKQIRPAPWTYKTHIQWPDKYDKSKSNNSKHKTNWFNKTTHNNQGSIYH